MARALLASVVSKMVDETSGAHYYFNSLTGETSWSKPALFGSEVFEDIKHLDYADIHRRDMLQKVFCPARRNVDVTVAWTSAPTVYCGTTTET